VPAALHTNDTIAALATPPGRGGIGILRLSGPDAVALASPLLRLRASLAPGRARFCEIVEPATGEKLDEAIATYFAAPHSYTGEHVLEIAAHGSPVLLNFLLRQVIDRGARLANPGEFTERAFFAGRLDLTQAEAVRDLIDAQTLYQARIAASQLDGALSRRVAPIKAALVALIAQLEAGIDFAEDDTPTLSAEAILARTGPIAAELATLAHSFEHGRLVHAGLTLAIVGEPNVGKSSLFNRLVERERAIVTATPGTTRDLVTERVSLGGIPVELVDTAGLREATDEAERLGIEKSREALAEAGLVLVVLDATTLLPRIQSPGHGAAESPPANAEVADLSPGNSNELSPTYPEERSAGALLRSLTRRRSILVLNKCDMLPGEVSTPGEGMLPAHANEPSQMQQRLLQIARGMTDAPIIATSARTGEGIAALRTAIEEQLQTPALAEQGAMLTNLRQHQAVAAAHTAIEAAQAAIRLPHEMLLLDLYTTLRHLDALTGETTPDDILNLIFSTFCIGK
jgi:tRNA modification GTPase